MPDRIGFVGLGTMGGPMAGHLAKAGYRTLVWNRTRSKAEALAGENLEIADSLETLGGQCEIIFLCVNRTEDVEACLRNLTKGAAPGTLFVDHSTISPSGAKTIHKDLASRGFRFIDAPITGGSMGAINGALTIFCGGSESDIDEAMPYLQAYAKRAERVGGAGAGQMMKMANQIAVGGALIALIESLSFSKKAGLDLEQTRSLLSGGAAGSWAMENYGPKILKNDHTPGFSVKNQRKDFGYCAEAAEMVDAAIPATLLVDDLLSSLEAEGQGELATTALFERMLQLGYER